METISSADMEAQALHEAKCMLEGLDELALPGLDGYMDLQREEMGLLGDVATKSVTFSLEEDNQDMIDGDKAYLVNTSNNQLWLNATHNSWPEGPSDALKEDLTDMANLLTEGFGHDAVSFFDEYLNMSDPLMRAYASKWFLYGRESYRRSVPAAVTSLQEYVDRSKLELTQLRKEASQAVSAMEKMSIDSAKKVEAIAANSDSSLKLINEIYKISKGTLELGQNHSANMGDLMKAMLNRPKPSKEAIPASAVEKTLLASQEGVYTKLKPALTPKIAPMGGLVPNRAETPTAVAAGPTGLPPGTKPPASLPKPQGVSPAGELQKQLLALSKMKAKTETMPTSTTAIVHQPIGTGTRPKTTPTSLVLKNPDTMVEDAKIKHNLQYNAELSARKRKLLELPAAFREQLVNMMIAAKKGGEDYIPVFVMEDGFAEFYKAASSGADLKTCLQARKKVIQEKQK